MKTKQIHKKLVLNKNTLVNLDNAELNAVGGREQIGDECATGEQETCISVFGYLCCTTYTATKYQPCPSCI